MSSIQFSWECAGAPPASIGRFRVEEALGEPYEATVELTLEDGDADVTSMLGRDATLTVERPPGTRRVSGIVMEVWEGHGHEGRGDAEGMSAKARVVPAFTLLGQGRNTRIFQDKTVPEILDDVLGAGLAAYSRQHDAQLSRAYPTREYCVQYQESDFDFAQRLMEEEGIFYSFDHEGPVEQMRLHDASQSCPEVPGGPIEHQPDSLHARDKEAVHAVDRAHRHATTAVTVRDWDWTRPGDMIVEAPAEGEDALGRVREAYEHGTGRSLSLTDYAAGARRYQADDAADQARLRQEAHAAENVRIEGIGRVLGFAPGMTFELVNHPTMGFDGQYLIVRCIHESEPVEGEEGNVEPYHNAFEAIPIATPFRSERRTPKPRIGSIQTAIVTGAPGEEIHVDEHGRIKVQFYWDRLNPHDDTSSCWVRCQQDWAGPGWGFWWVPRVGMEVVVCFVDGDPDRPIVTGCVYNASHTLPYAMPAEKTKSTIKSNSTPGGGGSNELRFEDAAGSEEIYAHAQKDYDEVVENDHSTLVHHDQTNTVDNDQTQTIHANQTERVDVDQTMSVGGDRSVHVEGNFDETVDGTETRHTTGDVTETFAVNETRTIASDVTESIGASETRTIGGNQTETIGASHTWSIGATSTVTVAGSMTQEVMGGVTSSTPAAELLVATGGMSVTVGGATEWVAPAGIVLVAPGGFTFIDSFNDWVGNHLFKWTPLSKSATGVKVEIGGLSLSATGAKLDAHFYELKFNASIFEASGADAKASPTEIDQGLALRGAAFELYG